MGNRFGWNRRLACGSPARPALGSGGEKNGVDISGLRGRQFTTEDFDRFDRIFVMDLDNYRDVLRKARSEADRQKVQLLLEDQQPVPDPWYDDALFEPVYRLIHDACERIVRLG
ncbi:hypothetical protein WJU16_17025 [Chitinophaga pollutisoli]|uniref:protein-tyrosine-phosphatase n=1 Tax=Chitinophaga pollutisoli TaxID=3133966 RepID=A0ABZ2YIY5_9BACT